MRHRLVACIAAIATIAAPATAGAIALTFSHAYGEFVDRGDVSAHIQSTDGMDLECPTSVSYAQIGNSITLTTRRAPPGQMGFATCRFISSVVLGALAAGTYQVTGRIRALDGTIAESVTQTLEVLPTGGRCNPDPALSPSVVGTPRGMSKSEFVTRIATDPAFAASLGHPAVRPAPFTNDVYFDFPPLDDIPSAMDRLAASGALSSQWRNARACPFSPTPPDQTAQFVEFFHAGLDHYFYTGDAGEIAAIEAGNVGPGWVRTGKSFRAVTEQGCPFTNGQTVVYRFFGVPGRGPNSHFFTRDRAECSLVDMSGQWSLEGVPFWAGALGADGTCATGVPLYRAWRPFGDSNHRFTTDRAVLADMVARGWVDEGPAMCVVAPS